MADARPAAACAAWFEPLRCEDACAKHQSGALTSNDDKDCRSDVAPYRADFDERWYAWLRQEGIRRAPVTGAGHRLNIGILQRMRRIGINPAMRQATWRLPGATLSALAASFHRLEIIRPIARRNSQAARRRIIRAFMPGQCRVLLTLFHDKHHDFDDADVHAVFVRSRASC